MPTWTFDDIPDPSGRTAIVTGANSGTGFETARALARKGAQAILAYRSLEKARDAADRLRAAIPNATVAILPLDLADLESVRAFATRFRAEHSKLDLLILNAGVMVAPESKTVQGFELQLGVNHLGHFALTGALLPLLTDTPHARVVVVSSTVASFGAIDFDDCWLERRRRLVPARLVAGRWVLG